MQHRNKTSFSRRRESRRVFTALPPDALDARLRGHDERDGSLFVKEKVSNVRRPIWSENRSPNPYSLSAFWTTVFLGLSCALGRLRCGGSGKRGLYQARLVRRRRGFDRVNVPAFPKQSRVSVREAGAPAAAQ